MSKARGVLNSHVIISFILTPEKINSNESYTKIRNSRTIRKIVKEEKINNMSEKEIYFKRKELNKEIKEERKKIEYDKYKKDVRKRKTDGLGNLSLIFIYVFSSIFFLFCEGGGGGELYCREIIYSVY